MYLKKLLSQWVVLVLVTTFVIPASTLAVTSTGSVGVGLTIPAQSPTPPPTGGGGPVSSPPTIGNLTVQVGATTSTVSWTVAVSGASVAQVSFAYSVDLGYGSTTSPIGAYSVSLNGLLPQTTYNFRIHVTDTLGRTATVSNQFTTATAPVPLPTNGAVISGVQVTPEETRATVRWTTDKPTTGQILYGITQSYGQNTQLEPSASLSHTQIVTNLAAGTTYHLTVAVTDESGNQTASEDIVFTTAKSVSAPPNVTNVEIFPSVSSFTVSWSNPSELLIPDFTGVRVMRTVGAPAANPQQGTLVYTGSGTEFNDSNVQSGVLYFYTLFSVNNSNLYSSGVSVSGRLTAAQPTCTVVDCANPACAQESVCITPPNPLPEICDNGLDDNGNGNIDCADSACVGFSACVKNNKPQTTPDATVNPSEKISLGALRFFTGRGKINLAIEQSTVTNLAGAPSSVVIGKNALPKTPTKILWNIDGVQYQAAELEDSYVVDFSFPAAGTRTAFVQIDYSSSERDVLPLTLHSLVWGSVNSGGKLLADAAVALYSTGGALIDTAVYGIPNPFATDINGGYGWVVPNGNYTVVVTKNGFFPYTSATFAVNHNVVNIPVTLVSVPPKLLESVTPTTSLPAAIGIVARNASQNVIALGKNTLTTVVNTLSEVRAFTNQPEVQNSVSNQILPTVVGVTAVGTLSVVGWADVLPLLRLLFLQPLMLLGRRKRASWGQVYNSLSKLPVDLAIVRLLDHATGRVIQTRVTDAKGRYAFITQPGTYRLSVVKGTYTFPSVLLQNFKDDGRRTDVYHGEVVTVTEKNVVIAANIPLDPETSHFKPRSVYWQVVRRTAQITLSALGLLITVASLTIAPRPLVFLLAGVHCVLLAIFGKLALPGKIKNWGIVYDEHSRKPLGRSVARLYNMQFDKLVDTQITDSQGRYYFLAGDNRYYVTYDHAGYAEAKSDTVDLSGTEKESINVDVGLHAAQNE